MMPSEIRAGMHFGRWLVLSHGPTLGHGNLTCECLCDCGKQKLVYAYNLTSGKSVSCGCFNREQTKQANAKHGHSPWGQPPSKEYRAWSNMKRRCSDQAGWDYKYYGGRGIAICERWLSSFENFLADMDECPKGLTLERRDVNGNYGPDNCYWASWSVQQKNKQLVTHCKRGHSFTPENTYRTGKRQQRLCRLCHLQRGALYRLKMKEAA